MKDILKKILKVTFWIVFWILSPIVAGLYFIWPSKIFKDKMSKESRISWWMFYAVIAFVIFALQALFFIAFGLTRNGNFDADGPSLRASDHPATYRTSEDFYKLTGVEFPELEMVDSLFFDEGIPPSDFWYEYKFVAKGGLSKDFKKRLKRACKTDSTHWSYSEGSLSDWFYEGTGEPIVGDQKIYKYWIYPDVEPVDRSRGMCDRMVKAEDENGSMIVDWDGSFISVEIWNDTIVLRNGWIK